MVARTAVDNPPTKARLLDAAQALMLAKGFSATSVDEICAKARLTKGSFFHYFDSKDALGKELLERFCADGRRLHASFCREAKDPLQRVYNYIDGTIALAKDPVTRNGCLLGTFAQEMCDTHPEIKHCCAAGFEAWAKAFAKELAAAKAAHRPKTNFEPRELAEHFIAVLEGALILSKTRNNARVVVSSLEHFRAYVRTLFGR